MPLKTLLVILDGLGDRCHTELDNRTPLEYAKTPVLDELAKRSETGILNTLEPGYCLNTDLAHMILFGYDEADYPGRCLIDLYGEGIPLKKNQIGLRTSWASVTGDGPYVLKERFVPDLSHFNALMLGELISGTFNEVHIEWHFSHDSHGFLIFEGEGLSSQISDSDPFYNHQAVMAVEPYDKQIESRYTADVVNLYLKYVHDRLKEHDFNKRRIHKGLLPANLLLTKWAGAVKEVDSFQVQNGMDGLLIAGSKLLQGLSRYIDLDFEMEKDFEKGLERALNSQQAFVCLHSKAPDEAAHTKNPMNKVNVIEQLDSHLKPLLDVDLDEWVVVITSDHSTPSSGELIHSGESVPVLVYGKNTRPDSVEFFGERSCLKGSHRLKGKDLMPLILNVSDRANLYHLRHGRKHRLYKPIKVNPLK